METTGGCAALDLGVGTAGMPAQGVGITKKVEELTKVEGTTEEIAINPDQLEQSAPGRNGNAEAQASAETSKSKDSGESKKPAKPSRRTLPQAQDLAPRDPVSISLRSLLEAGVHFGHQTSRWNPKMSPFIYGVRNGIHIVNLPRTIECWERARAAIVEVVSKGGSVLFVGTKKQAQDPVVEEARRCGAYFVSRRWLGGMMTNFQTIRKSINRMNRLDEILAEEEQAQAEGTGTKFTKKERLMMSREREKLEFSLGGIREMFGAPQLVFVIDLKREDIAVKEAARLDIPVVALVDTNCDPSLVTYPIPSNDDGTRAIRLFCSAVCDAVMEGKKAFSKRKDSGGAGVRSSRKRGGSQGQAASAPEKATEGTTPAEATAEQKAEPAPEAEKKEATTAETASAEQDTSTEEA